MSQRDDIDPQLRETAHKLNPGLEDASCARTSSPPLRLQPTSQSANQGQPSPQPQQYAPYAQNHSGLYYGPSPVQQYGQGESAGDFHAFATVPAASHPGLQYVSKAGGDFKRLRACEACRGLKVRCEPDPNCGPCKRCLKSSRKCEITVPSRKRQKKTDSRVSELEKQLADIQAQLRVSGRIARDGESQSYDAKGPSLIDSLGRRHTTQPFYPRSENRMSIGLDDQLLLGGSQTSSEKFPRSEMTHNGPLEGQTLRSLQGSFPTFASLSSNSSLGDIADDVRIIASSMDTGLAVTLLIKYVTSMLPQKQNVGAILVNKVTFLQRSKPVLFIAIMMLMLQTWGKDTTKDKNSSKKGDSSEKGNQALHLLSEVATGNSGSKEEDETEKLGTDAVIDGSGSGQTLAHALAKKLLDADDGEANTDIWFEKLMQEFH